MTPEQFVGIINEYFKPPFVEEGHVEAWIGPTGSVNLRIGQRDIAIDWGKGEVWASGCSPGEVACQES